ncbi:MAG: UDP-N-acetylglucosamine 2-epimerase (non-hydrolyzing) [Clostridia bacterium]|nr:UDP-N-acetylglucosamine 2-epimerase (non-hydrolyzing) [Clostridia bacterium]
MRYLVIYGTRPEAIKLAPLLAALRKKKTVEIIEVNSAQHSDMLSPLFKELALSPNYNLALRRTGQSLAEFTACLKDALIPIYLKTHPDAVLVQGDTATALVAAETAFLESIPVLHIEAGLRSHDLFSPFPEEYCRRVIALTASHHFAPTEDAKENLIREKISPEAITVTGNTGIDHLVSVLDDGFTHPILEQARGKRLILFTAHRRENWGEPLGEALAAMATLLAAHPECLLFYPMHKNPDIREAAQNALRDTENAILSEPLSPYVFSNLLFRADAVFTDSGGIQEEAVALGKPTLVLRNRTERGEGVRSGHLTLTPCRYQDVLTAGEALLASLANTAPPPSTLYGTGNASTIIANLLADENFLKNFKQI